MLVRLYADYAPWPLWKRRGIFEEDELPLSNGLKDRIRAWLNAYDEGHPRPDWPMWMPPPGADDQEQAWVDEGAVIRDLIAAELGPDYEVTYET